MKRNKENVALSIEEIDNTSFQQDLNLDLEDADGELGDDLNDQEPDDDMKEMYEDNLEDYIEDGGEE